MTATGIVTKVEPVTHSGPDGEPVDGFIVTLNVKMTGYYPAYVPRPEVGSTLTIDTDEVTK